MVPKITIITPTYDHQAFISKCIQSVISQNYQDWEQIIVDDASSDKTYEIASKFAHKDKRIKIIRHKKNWGITKLADSYNQALNKAGGKYIAILEGDDFWPKDKLERQISMIEKSGAVFSYGDSIMTDSSGLPIKIFTYDYARDALNNNPTGSILPLFATLKFSIIPVTAMIKTSVLKDIGGFQKDNYYPFTDIPTFLALSLRGNFLYINDVLGYYRKQQNSSWFRFASKTRSMGKEEVQKCFNNFLLLNKKNPRAKKLLKMKSMLQNSQAKLINNKWLTKPISIFLNSSAFRGGTNPLFAIFVFQYATYKFKKLFK